MHSPRLAAAAAALLLAAHSPGAQARDDDEEEDRRFSRNFSPTGWIIELAPAGHFCLPTAAVKCKTDAGQNGPFVGGGFAFGYKPVRHIAIGLSYVGGGLRPSWNLPTLDDEPSVRTYDSFAHIHGVYAWGRPTLGLGRFDLGAELAFGWSYSNFDLTTPADTTMTSNGLSVGFGAVGDFYVHPRVAVGVKVMFIMNIQTKITVKGPMGKVKRTRTKGDDQFPVHQVFPGLHFSFILG